MHPHDMTCKWCGFSPLYVSRWSDFVGNYAPQYNPHTCRLKPPQTPEEGAAAAMGLYFMALAIRDRESSCLDGCTLSPTHDGPCRRSDNVYCMAPGREWKRQYRD